MSYMNPFEFVPLPPGGPRKIPAAALEGPRYEGFLTFSLNVLTPLHITGRATSEGGVFEKKYFHECCESKVIPGSSLRGMLFAYIEAVTGSDLGSFTRGDEGDEDRGRRPYGKWYAPGKQNAQKCRHVGFMVAAPDDVEAQKKAKGANYGYDHNGQHKRRNRYERSETLPAGFGFSAGPRAQEDDMARFLFGHVPGGEEGAAWKGRLMFEDLAVPEGIELVDMPAWDLKGEAVMGCPNPRAGTAWYFTPGDYRQRRTANHDVWEVLAGGVRGRKFYFHQHPESCHAEYRKWSRSGSPNGWMDLAEYKVEAIPAGSKIGKGRIDFTDLPMPVLLFLCHSLMLEGGQAHKLGALKPFGFGSVSIRIEELRYRALDNPLVALESQGLKGMVPNSVYDPVARAFLRRIMHFPLGEEEKEWYRFVYPPFNTDRTRKLSPAEKGFAMVESADGGRRFERQGGGYGAHRGANHGAGATGSGSAGPGSAGPGGRGPGGWGRPVPGSSEKTTLHFDHYQMKAANFPKVMGGRNYDHLLKPGTQ